MPRDAICVGLMSGTSADGVDAAVVRFGDDQGAVFELLAFETVPYPADLRREIIEVCDARTGTVDRVCRLDAVLGGWFADTALAAIERSGLRPADVRAIGSHGQTVHHLPDADDAHGQPARSTLQIGNPSVIAERTGIATVSDFRSRDVALGGQGAPLVPLVDFLLCRSETSGRVLANIGGIANVTVLPAGCTPEQVVAFDTGPGNAIIDGLASRMTDGAMAFDEDGKIAASGRVNRELLDAWCAHPFLEQPPPKSTGREAFGEGYVDALVEKYGDVPMADLVATATAFTARTLVDGLRTFAPDFDRVSDIYVSGGGSLNPVLMDAIRECAGTGIDVGVSGDLGLPADAKEAVAFALLAHRTMNGLPGNLPAATGASRAAILGSVTPADRPNAG